METRLIGDLHGDFQSKTLMTPNSIQLGDLDLYGYDNWFFSDYPRFFICGNHDRFSILNPDGDDLQTIVQNLVYIPRGYVSGEVLFVGGAASVDRDQRIPGHSWYPEEELTQRQFHKIMSINTKISVIVSHDCPTEIFNKINMSDNTTIGSNHRNALTEIFNKFQPKLSVFGHHHTYFDQTINNCRFVCIPSNRYMNFNLPLSNDIQKHI